MAVQLAWSLYLDDIRVPDTSRTWVIARSCGEAQTLVSRLGMPDFISFDHDLGDEVPTGYDFAHWLVECDLDKKYCFSKDFTYAVHSANPPGAANIRGLMDNYLKHLGSVTIP
jgi:hypothetical protein